MKTLIKKITLIALVLLGIHSTIDAQQLIHQSEKSWRIHHGLIGGAGLSNALPNSIKQQQSYPEGQSKAVFLFAPRPEVNVGLFSEIEKGKLSFQTSLTYTMRSIPAPVFINAGVHATNTYQSLYLNGLTLGGVFFVKPVPKVKIGLGFDMTHFFMTKELKEGDYSDYALQYTNSRSIKTVVAYSVDPRTDVNFYVAAVNTRIDKMQIDNITAGIAVTYKLCGKEIKIQKEVYKLDYTE